MFRLLVLSAFILATTVPADADWYKDCTETADPDRSIRGCTEILKRGKRESRENRSVSYNNRGIAYAKKGQHDRAIADFDQAIKVNPREALAYYNRGVTYDNKGQTDRAIADYDQAIKLNPRESSAYNNRGHIYEKLGQKEKAIADLREALKLDPSMKESKEALKRLGEEP